MYFKIRSVFPVVLLLCVLFLWVVPVCADDGSVSITYRGAGGYYVGDTILFDGKNTMGNTTVLLVTGPGLPAAGVPPYNLSGTAGAGNTAEVDPAGTWAFYWDTSRVENADRFYTARYTLTVFDKNHPDVTASTSVMLKKPEFYVSVTPNPATANDYVVINGYSEKGADTIEIDVLDGAGNRVHTFMAPVSSGGAFNSGFHVDMSPGQYAIKVSSPSFANSLTRTLVIAASRANESGANATVTTLPTVVPAGTGTTPGTGALVVSSKPAGATVSLDSTVVGQTPLTLSSVAAGTHTVGIKLPGYLTSTTDVIITEGQTAQIAPELVKSPGSLPLSPILAVMGCLGAAGILVAVRRRK